MNPTPDTQGKKNLHPYPVVIAAAVSSNLDAINVIVKQFEGFIARLSTRTMYDEADNPHLYINEELRCRLET